MVTYNMNKVKNILQELGISKVKLSKYLGVSRQMIYNYLELDSLNSWPKEKKILLLKLLNIDDASDKALNSIKVTPTYMMEVEARLNQTLKDSDDELEPSEIKKLAKSDQQLYSDIVYLIKDKLTEGVHHDESVAALTYLYHILQSLDNVNEVKYFLAYISKLTGFSDPNEFAFNEDKQFIFEGIVHSAITLYTNGGASKARVIESHSRFVQEIERKKEEVLSRTEQLNTITIQALRELGFNKLTQENSREVLEKMAEIEARRV